MSGHTVNAMRRDSSSLGGEEIVVHGFAVHQMRKGGQEFSSHFNFGGELEALEDRLTRRDRGYSSS